MDGTKRLRCSMYLKHMPLKIVGFVGREWFHAQEYVKVGVGALHKGIGKTKQDAKKEVVYSRENCGVVDRRAAAHQAPTTHPPTNTPPQQYITAVEQYVPTNPQQQRSSTAVPTAAHREYARGWVGFALPYDPPPSGGEREPSPREAFHASR